MDQIELLEQELKMMLENIDRLKLFKANEEKNNWRPFSSLVFGELKHRCTAIKQRLTMINRMSTSDVIKRNDG